MKNNIKFGYLIILFIIFTSCTDNFTELNVNPNKVTAVPYTALVSHAQNNIARTYYANANTKSWCRYEVRNVYVQNDRYEFDAITGI